MTRVDLLDDRMLWAVKSVPSKWLVAKYWRFNRVRFSVVLEEKTNPLSDQETIAVRSYLDEIKYNYADGLRVSDESLHNA